MSSGVGTGSGKQNPSRGNRLDPFGQSVAFAPPQGPFKNDSFGSVKQGWDNSNIWGGGGLPRNTSYDTPSDTESLREPSFGGSNGIVSEGRKGSSSLLASSESDGWTGRQSSQWPPLGNVPSTKSNLSSNHVSPTKLRFLEDTTPLQPDIARGNSPYFPPATSRPSTTFGNSSGPTNGFGPHRRSDTTFSSFQQDASDDELGQLHSSSSFSSNLNNSTFRQDLSNLRSESDFFSNHDLRLGSSKSNSSRIPPPALNQTRVRPSGPNPYSHFSTGSLSALPPTSGHSPHPSLKSLSNDAGLVSIEYDESLIDGFGELQIHHKNSKAHSNGFSPHRPSFGSQSSLDASQTRILHSLGSDRAFPENSDADFPSALSEHRHTSQIMENPRALRDARSRIGNAGISTNVTALRSPSAIADNINGFPGPGYPSASPNNHPSTIGRRAGRAIAPMNLDSQPYTVTPTNSRLPYPYPYDVATQMQLNVNLGPKYFQPAPNLYNGFHNFPAMQKFANADHDSNQRDRSPLLKDFKATHKTKEWELKDIYGHFVEFCGDQHASRMIQLKLETANGDEKEQIFREILPESYAVMTDIFGNYVIQKLFEHGDQWQKKNLANHMKGHVYRLTKQTFGCRVVQKALEHVLAEQQASLIHELDRDVIDCVKDQNGNHVIQKAIEMVDGKHLEVIIQSVLKDVRGLAMDKFGCRVVQRMLEYCNDRVKERMTRDLRPHIQAMVIHQFGNYVIQNILINGPDEDRRLVTNEVLSNLLFYCKNKFASNVVEKALDYSAEDQKAKIVKRLTTSNDKGESAVIGLVHDSYGNYVIQKVLKDLPIEERDRISNEMRPHLVQMKKIGCGAKPIAAVEKVIYESDRAHDRQQDPDREASHSSPSTSQSSSLLPSTNASTVEGPIHKDESSEASDRTIQPEMQTTDSPVALEADQPRGPY